MSKSKERSFNNRLARTHIGRFGNDETYINYCGGVEAHHYPSQLKVVVPGLYFNWVEIRALLRKPIVRYGL